jgi:hypothetical protein
MSDPMLILRRANVSRKGGVPENQRNRLIAQRRD